MQKKFTKIIEIFDGKTSLLKLKGFVKFEDNWITENNKTLLNQQGEKFFVLEFKEIEENVLTNPHSFPQIDTWKFRKFSCAKLDKIVNVGDSFCTE